LSETRTNPTKFLGDLGRKKVRSGPVGSVWCSLAITRARFTHIELCVENDEFGAGRDQVVAMIGSHELCIHQLRVVIYTHK